MLALITGWFTNWVIGYGGIALLAAVVAWILFLATPTILLPLKETIMHIAIGLTVFFFLASAIFTKGYDSGYGVAINQVAAKNRKATDAVNKIEKTVDECFASGRTFNDTSGVCE